MMPLQIQKIMTNSQPTLTRRESHVLKLLVDGYSNEEVGIMLGLSQRTIEAHRARIMLKLNLHDLAGLVKYSILAGINSVNEHRSYSQSG